MQVHLVFSLVIEESRYNNGFLIGNRALGLKNILLKSKKPLGQGHFAF
jgi:hypothetical protein